MSNAYTYIVLNYIYLRLKCIDFYPKLGGRVEIEECVKFNCVSN